MAILMYSNEQDKASGDRTLENVNTIRSTETVY